MKAHFYPRPMKMLCYCSADNGCSCRCPSAIHWGGRSVCGILVLRLALEGQQQNELEKHATDLKAYFEAHLPQTAAEAQAVIEQRTGIYRGLTQVRTFLHELGMDFSKVGAVLSKGEPEVQEDFKKKSSCLDSKKPKQALETFISWMRCILSFGRS